MDSLFKPYLENYSKFRRDELSEPLHSFKNQLCLIEEAGWMLKKIGLDDFNVITTLGKGTYGKVVLVQRKDEGEEIYYAMKMIKKKFVEAKKLSSNLKIEREILIQCDHPLIVKLFSAFQDETRLFFLMEFCQGGDFFKLIEMKGKLTEDQIRIYAIYIVVALEYLHQKNIVYRDLKPENILIDQHGMIRLADFGLSKKIVEGSQLNEYGGTLDYMAPQFFAQPIRYGKPVDWWALGCLLYELKYGFTPFVKLKNNTESTRKEKIRFEAPSFRVGISKQFQDLLLRLLSKDPCQRIGSKEGAIQIKNHPYFSQVDWLGIQNKNLLHPSFVPELHSKTDLSYFDRVSISDRYSSEVQDEGARLEGFSFTRAVQF